MATQQQVIDKLEPQAIKAIDQLRDRGAIAVSKLWENEKANLRRIIMEVYQRDFPRDSWTIVSAKASLDRISHATSFSLSAFLRSITQTSADVFRDLYRQSALRSAWILDQVTPDTVKVNLPQSGLFRESSVGVTYQGPNADTAWRARISQWTDAYHASLIQNLKLGAMNESAMSDAIDEVDATRAGTPAMDLGYVFDRIFMYQAQSVIVGGQVDVAKANRALGVKEIWQTRYNARVCEICDEQAGKTPEEATEEMPPHPNCECYWRLVPASFADLLTSDQFGDHELARRIDAAQLPYSGMYVRDGEGGVAAMTTITFQKWLDGRSLAVTGK